MNNDHLVTPAEAKRRQKAIKVQELALEGLTQKEIGKRVGMSQRGVGLLLARLTGGKAVRKAATTAQRQARAVTAAAALGVPSEALKAFTVTNEDLKAFTMTNKDLKALAVTNEDLKALASGEWRETVRPSRQRAPGAGRKPAGDGGERVKDYPSVMLRLPIATLAKLKAAAAVQGVPSWRVINAAVLAYVEALTGAEAEDVRRMAKREAERLKVKHGG